MLGPTDIYTEIANLANIFWAYYCIANDPEIFTEFLSFVPG